MEFFCNNSMIIIRYTSVHIAFRFISVSIYNFHFLAYSFSGVMGKRFISVLLVQFQVEVFDCDWTMLVLLEQQFLRWSKSNQVRIKWLILLGILAGLFRQSVLYAYVEVCWSSIWRSTGLMHFVFWLCFCCGLFISHFSCCNILLYALRSVLYLWAYLC